MDFSPHIFKYKGSSGNRMNGSQRKTDTGIMSIHLNTISQSIDVKNISE
jgi:hypothetical protein